MVKFKNAIAHSIAGISGRCNPPLQ